MGKRPAIVACAFALLALPAIAAGAPIALQHIHGLAYSADGKVLIVASHEGLATYSDRGWSMGPGLRHDFMGFSATHDHFYSSGHPAASTQLG